MENCPSDEDLAAFAEGVGGEAEREALAEHLCSCRPCLHLLADVLAYRAGDAPAAPPEPLCAHGFIGPCAECEAVRARLFIGLYPEGVVFADRRVHRASDFKRLAFLPYRTLALDVAPDCPPDLEREIRAIAARDYQPGAVLQVTTCGQTVTLGSEEPLTNLHNATGEGRC